MILISFALLVFFLVAIVSADAFRRSYYAERRARATDDVEAAEECAEFAAQRDQAIVALLAAQKENAFLRSTVELRDGDFARLTAEVSDLANEVAVSQEEVRILEICVEDLTQEKYALEDAVAAAAPKRRGRPVGAKTKAKK